MATLSPANQLERPISQAKRWEITEQLRRVLASSSFRTSARCSQLLRHVVEGILEGQDHRLRERQIAVDIFHRKPTYDNNADPVVRIAAGEVRKRLALYYGSPETTGEVRIELPVGSYIPSFHFPAHIAEPVPVEAVTLVPEFSEQNVDNAQNDSQGIAKPEGLHDRSTRPFWSRYLVYLLALSFVLVLAAAATFWHHAQPSASVAGFDTFWLPIVSSTRPPLVSVGELQANDLTFVPNMQRNPHSGAISIQPSETGRGGISVERFADVVAVSKISSVLGGMHKSFDVRSQSNTNINDMGTRPMIVLGSYDNDWLMPLFEGQRFQLRADYSKKMGWISDANHPNVQLGALSLVLPEPANYDVYSIVLRRSGLVSKQPRVVLAGVGDKGTEAAAEFVSNPDFLNEFAKHAPVDWQNKNVEFLLKTRVFENMIGVPSIVDYNIW